MADEGFNARLARISKAQAQTDEGAMPRPTANRAGQTSPLRPFLWGAAASVVVLLLFSNIQAISDMAPASIRNSEMPGAFGLPVAIASVLWFVMIPIWFVISVIVSAVRGRGILPSAFVLGAFVALAIGFVLMKILGPAST
jgi:hypothetical protein